MPAPFTNGIVREGYGHECYGRKDTLRMVLTRKGVRGSLDHAGTPFTEHVLFELEMPDTPESRMGLKGWDRPHLGKEIGTVAKFGDGVLWVDGAKELGWVGDQIPFFRRDAR